MNKTRIVVLAFVCVFAMLLGSNIPVKASNVVQVGLINPYSSETICGKYVFNFWVDGTNISSITGASIYIASLILDIPLDHFKTYGNHVYGYMAIDTKAIFAESPYAADAHVDVAVQDAGTYSSSNVHLTIDNDFGNFAYATNTIREYNLDPSVEFTMQQDMVMNGQAYLPAVVHDAGAMAQNGTTWTPARTVNQDNDGELEIYAQNDIPSQNSATQQGDLQFVNENLNTKEYNDGPHWFTASVIFGNLARCTSRLQWVNVQNNLPPASTTIEILPYMVLLYALPIAIGLLVTAGILGLMPAPGARIFAGFLLLMSIVFFIVYFFNQGLLSAAMASSYDWCFWFSTVALIVVLAGIVSMFVPLPGWRIAGAVLLIVGIVIFFAIQFLTENTTPIDEILRNLRHSIPMG